MPTYRVTWAIDLETESPIKAAEEALRIQRDPDSIATEFGVVELIGNKGVVIKNHGSIDLYN